MARAYFVVEDRTKDGLQDIMQKVLGEEYEYLDWRCEGGIYIMRLDDGLHFYQAVTVDITAAELAQSFSYPNI